MASAVAQAPPAVPALPDTQRLTAYSITSSQCVCSVGFALYADGTDVDNWIQVFIGTTRYLSTDPTFGWSLSSPTGPLSSIPRPITDAVLTFNSAQTGSVQIIGARRPRRLSQFPENRGVSARDLNVALTDIVAQNREAWDRGLTGGGGGGGGTVGFGSAGQLATYASNGNVVTGTSTPAVQTLSLIATDPNAAPQTGVPIQLFVNPDFTGAQLPPQNFNTEAGINVNINAENGVNAYNNSTCTNVTCSKNTYIAYTGVADYNAAGQHNAFGMYVWCFGNGDCSNGQSQIDYYGGQIAGDEGKGFNLTNLVSQGIPGNGIVTRTIGAVSASSCNTTLAQVVTATGNVQAVQVVQNAFCLVGDWVQFDHGPFFGGSANMSAAQITAVGAGPCPGVGCTISARILNNYASGKTVTGATVIQMTQNDMDGMGQQRFLVNLSGTAYGTSQTPGQGGGTQAKGDNPGFSIGFSGNEIMDGQNGSGTIAWAPGMVGGNSNNIGCMYLANDDLTNFQGTGTTLHSWYPILQVTSASTLRISSWDTATNNSYWSTHGGTFGTYLIRPCIQILYRDTAHNKIIAETTTTAWSAGNSVEVAFFADPDVGMHREAVATYTAGGRNRSMVGYGNVGARVFQTAINIDGSQNMVSGGGADNTAFVSGIKIGIGSGNVCCGNGIEILGAWNGAPASLGAPAGGAAIMIDPQTGAAVKDALQFNNWNGATGNIWHVNMGVAAAYTGAFANAGDLAIANEPASNSTGSVDLIDTGTGGLAWRAIHQGTGPCPGVNCFNTASMAIGADGAGQPLLQYGPGTASRDVFLYRDATKIFAINGAYGTGLSQAAAGIHVYNNIDSTQPSLAAATVVEYGTFDFTTSVNALTIGSIAGTGGSTRNVRLVAGGTPLFTLAAATPTANACAGFVLGTGSTDTAGKLTYTSATSCAINFGRTFTNAPACTVMPGSAASTVEVTTTTTVLTATFGTAQTAMSWLCFGS
jgi:hypothetical protein